LTVLQQEQAKAVRVTKICKIPLAQKNAKKTNSEYNITRHNTYNSCHHSCLLNSFQALAAAVNVFPPNELHVSDTFGPIKFKILCAPLCSWSYPFGVFCLLLSFFHANQRTQNLTFQHIIGSFSLKRGARA